jgi:type II secretory pathway component PulK
MNYPYKIKNQSGIALIQVIITTAIIMLLMTFFLTAAKSQVNRAQALQNKTAAFLSNYSAQNQVLYQLLTADYIELESEGWNFHGTPFQPNPQTTVSLQDLNGLLSLASLSQEYLLQRTLAQTLSEADAQTIAQSLMDWIDKDAISRASGAEQSYYDSQGIVVRNGPIQTFTELAFINGMTIEAEEALIMNTTVHPTPFFNVMSAPEALLAAFLKDDSIANDVIGLRGSSNYSRKSVQELTQVYNDEGINYLYGPGFRLTIHSKVADSYFGRTLEVEVYPYRDKSVEVLSRLPIQQLTR